MLVECDNCEAIVDGSLVANYEAYDEESGILARFSLLKCPKCARPFLMFEDYLGRDSWDEPSRIYPPVRMGISAAIPDSLRSAYEEARRCFRARAFTSTAIMCRKTLEGIAEENQITARNLDTALKEMREKGIIETRLYEWADALRISGNEAAHGVGVEVSSQDARDILEFTHALLEYVFTFQEKFKQFKKRHSPSEENGPEVVPF